MLATRRDLLLASVDVGMNLFLPGCLSVGSGREGMNAQVTRRSKRGAASAIVLTLLAPACTGGGAGASRPGYSASFAAVECPGRVMASATRETSCGYLTVPEDRSDPSGRQIRLFVVRYAPNKPTTAAPVVFAGTDLGSGIDYVDLPRVADHLDGPEVIGLEARGTGYSDPNLSCPEVDAISPQTLTARIADPGARRAFVEAVSACYARFADQGIDLSAYNVEEAGADLLDLVRALDLHEWNVLTKGSASRIVFSAMRSDPPGLRAVVAQSPEFPDTDTFTQAIEGTQAAVSELETLCEADHACVGRFPDLAATFEVALRRFDEHPRTVRVGGKNVPVDGARLLRDLRNLMASTNADDPMYLHLPATIDELAYGKDPTSSITAVVSPELSAPPYCTGYLPECGPSSQGAYYSVLCSDIAPFADREALTSLAGEGNAWEEDYVDGPYQDVCGAWPVARADGAVAAAVRSDVPMLVLAGGLDPNVAPDVARRELAGSPNAFMIVTPAQGRAATAMAACPYSMPRNEFLADPTTRPNARCQERFRPTFANSPL